MKRINLVLGLIMLIGLVVFVSASMTKMDTGQYMVEMPIEKGWNILPCFFPQYEDLEISEIKKEDIKVVWIYPPQIKEYVQVFPKNNLDNVPENVGRFLDDEQMLSVTSCWVYSSKIGTIRYSTPENVPNLNDRKLFSGWNFIVITPNMINPGDVLPKDVIKIEDFSSDCNILKSYIWDSEHQGWQDISNQGQFYSRSEGMGWVIKVSDDCTLGSSEEVGDETTPPTLP